MRRFLTVLGLFIVLIVVIFSVQGKWDIYLVKGMSYFYNIKDNIYSNTVYSVKKTEDSIQANDIDCCTVTISNDEINILGLGDSLTKGFGGDNGKGYFHMFADYLGDRGINVNTELLVKKGRASTGLIDSVQEESNHSYIKEADLIFITVGGNDIVRVVKEKKFSVTLDDIMSKKTSFRKNLEDTIHTINSINNDVEIFILGLYNPFLTWINTEPEPFKALYIWNEEYKSIDTNIDNVHYIPIDDLFREDSEKFLYDDNFHPNQKGYAKITDRLIEYISLEEGG